MSADPMRFRVADNQAQRTLGGNIMEVHPDGPYVLFGDYARLKAEVERLTKENETINKDRALLWASHKIALQDIKRLHYSLQAAKGVQS